ncbi:MAG: CvpA family protein [Treponema sp.]|jgi:membrane protein required for colicin V production|nr:CvpA family protein [Treponema sp.]
MAVIDIIFLILIFIFAIHAGLKGFVEQISSIASVILGVLAGFFFYKNGADFLKTKLPSLEDVKVLPEILSFIILFFIAFAAVKFIGALLKNIVESVHLGKIDKVLGFLVGAVEGFALVAVVIFVIRIQPLFEPSSVLTGSVFAQSLSPLLEVFK